MSVGVHNSGYGHYKTHPLMGRRFLVESHRSSSGIRVVFFLIWPSSRKAIQAADIDEAQAGPTSWRHNTETLTFVRGQQRAACYPT
eukprot:6048020-Prymnesium_polylepis.2